MPQFIKIGKVYLGGPGPGYPKLVTLRGNELLEAEGARQGKMEVKVFISDKLWASIPRPPFTDQYTEAAAKRVYTYVWQRHLHLTAIG